MSIIKRMRKQDAVYWEPVSQDRYGNETYKDPVDVKCRWQTASKEEKDSLNLQVDVTDVVYPDRALKIGGMLLEGTVSELAKKKPPPPEAKRIQGTGKIPNLRATETLHIAGL